MSGHDGTTAPLVVGMVVVTYPACAQPIETDVRIESVSTKNGSYVEVLFQREAPTHRCAGRRS